MCGGSGKRTVIEGQEGNLGGQTLKLKKQPKVLFKNGEVQPGTRAYEAKARGG